MSIPCNAQPLTTMQTVRHVMGRFSSPVRDVVMERIVGPPETKATQ